MSAKILQAVAELNRLVTYHSCVVSVESHATMQVAGKFQVSPQMLVSAWHEQYAIL